MLECDVTVRNYFGATSLSLTQKLTRTCDIEESSFACVTHTVPVEVSL